MFSCGGGIYLKLNTPNSNIGIGELNEDTKIIFEENYATSGSAICLL